MRTPKSLKNKRGFTLVEAFIAMSILAITAASLLALLYVTFGVLNDIRESITASSVIHQKVEQELRKKHFDQICGSSGAVNGTILRNASFDIKVSPYPGESSTGPNLLTAVVKVTWEQPLSGQSKEKSVVTYIARGGINSIYTSYKK